MIMTKMTITITMVTIIMINTKDRRKRQHSIYYRNIVFSAHLYCISYSILKALWGWDSSTCTLNLLQPVIWKEQESHRYCINATATDRRNSVSGMTVSSKSKAVKVARRYRRSVWNSFMQSSWRLRLLDLVSREGYSEGEKGYGYIPLSHFTAKYKTLRIKGFRSYS